MNNALNRNAQIGNICIQWSNLEYMTAIAIWNLAGVDLEVGKIITANLDLKQRVGMAFALSHTVNAPVSFRNQIKRLQTALRDENLIDLRNQAVHGIHFQIDRPDAVGIEMHRGPGGRNQRTQTDEELAKLGARLSDLRMEMTANVMGYIRTRHGAQVEALGAFKALAVMIEKSSDTNLRGEE